MSDNTLITVTISDSTENVTVTTEDTTPNVTVNTTETTDEVTVQVFKSLTRQQFDVLIDQKMKAGEEENLSAGLNFISFSIDSQFEDENYSVTTNGYNNNFTDWVQTKPTQRLKNGFYVYCDEDCEIVTWIAVKH